MVLVKQIACTSGHDNSLTMNCGLVQILSLEEILKEDAMLKSMRAAESSTSSALQDDDVSPGSLQLAYIVHCFFSF